MQIFGGTKVSTSNILSNVQYPKGVATLVPPNERLLSIKLFQSPKSGQWFVNIEKAKAERSKLLFQSPKSGQWFVNDRG